MIHPPNVLKRPRGWQPTCLYEAVQFVFPNATMVWQGTWNTRSFQIEWNDGHIVGTPNDDDKLTTWICFYRDDEYIEGHAPNFSVDIDNEHVVTFLDELTDLQPEGVDFYAWAAQWISDNHETVKGLSSWDVPE